VGHRPEQSPYARRHGRRDAEGGSKSLIPPG
jgi:hypothetical protein